MSQHGSLHPIAITPVRTVLPAAVLLALSFVSLVWLNFRPILLSDPLVALFPPWLGPVATMRAAASAGARLVAPSPLPFGVIVQSSQSGFVVRLHRAGAWLVLDAAQNGLCGSAASAP